MDTEKTEILQGKKIEILEMALKQMKNNIKMHSPLILLTKEGKTVLSGTGTESDGWFIKLWVVAKYPKIVFATYLSERKNREVKICDSIIESMKFIL